MTVKHIRLACLLTSLLFSLFAQAQERPNVVVILSDDQGWGDLSSSGNTNLQTPNVDSIGRDGASFDRFFVCPVCSPTRAEFLTGRYHPRSGVRDVSSGGERIDLDETTIADCFLAAGYRTACYGKWHNGMQPPYHPNARGFQDYYGFCSGHWGDYFSPMLEHNGRLTTGEGFLVDDLTNHGLKFIEENQGSRFFLYLPYNTPHTPLQVPDKWWAVFQDKPLTLLARPGEKEDIDFTRAALAMCENIDWNVGRVLQKLEDLKLVDNTIVLYFCDNGPNGVRWNGGMKGRKGSTDEGGVRSPLLIKWPDRIPPGTRIPQIAGAIDLLPTLADLTGVPITSKKPLDGVSLKPLLTGQKADWPDRMLFSCWNKKVSVRTQQFRLDHQGQLYDLAQDPGQDRDLSRQHPDVAQRLTQAVARWKQEMFPGLGEDTRPFLIGHPDYRYTQIPARDGTPHGHVQRSNKAPNCSYFTNWTSVDDKITWEADVGATGDYEVVLYYTCPAADVGSTFQLRFNNSTLTGRITQAHDPPLEGAADDRVPRTESYVKDFKPLKLGTIHLEQGPGTLTLQATDVPGKQVMDFRLMMFTKLR